MNRGALTLAATLALAAGSACAQLQYSYLGPPVAIPDSPTGNCGPEGIAEIYVRDPFEIDSLTVGLIVPHACQGDLKLSLTHVETATTVPLVARPGLSTALIGFESSNFGGDGVPMTFADAAASSYTGASVPAPGIAGVTGQWKPLAPLLAFRRQNALGRWRLRAQDCAGLDTGSVVAFTISFTPATSCYPNCDRSVQAPVLNIADFGCFLQKFAAGDPYANCDNSTQAPVLTIADLTCFLVQFAGGCGAP